MMDVHNIAPLPAAMFRNQPPPPMFFFKRIKKRNTVREEDRIAPLQVPPPGPVQLSVALRAQPLQAARKRKSAAAADEAGTDAPIEEEKLPTVAEKRARLLEQQKERCKALRVDDTQIKGVDSKLNDYFVPLWLPLYNECMFGRRESFAKTPLSQPERELLVDRIKNTYCFRRWMDSVSRPDVCHNRSHVDVEQRNDAVQFSVCANAKYHDVSREPATASCFCALTDAVLLCNDLSHKHTKEGWATQIDATHTEATSAFNFEKSVESIDRYRDRLTFGSFNQNIVASHTFGRGTRSRWDALLFIADHHCTPIHSIALFNQFDDRMHSAASLRELRYCLDAFASKVPSSAYRRKPADIRMALLPRTITHLRQGMRPGDYYEPRFVRDAGYFDANHPVHWRFDACDGNQTTLGILLFLEATGNSLWLRVWELWVEILVTHCETCNRCRLRIVDFLCCVALLDQLTPKIIARTYINRLSQLLTKLKDECDQ